MPPMGDVMRLLLMLACLCMAVAGCGDSDRGNMTLEDDMTLEDISGIWENTITYVDVDTGAIYEDEAYVVIQTDGSYRRYDFDGDDVGDGGDCYNVSEMAITPAGGHEFKLTAGVVTINTIQADRMERGFHIRYDEKNMDFIETELTLEDFVPLCKGSEQYALSSDQGQPTITVDLGQMNLIVGDSDANPEPADSGTLYQNSDTDNTVSGNVYIYAH